jgi:hypothetical protein
MVPMRGLDITDRRLVIAVALGILLAAGPAASEPAGDRAAKRSTGGVAAQLREAKALRERSRETLSRAAEAYRAVLRADAGNLEAQRGLARVLRDQGAEEEAIPLLQAVAQRSNEGVDYARWGWALLRAGRWPEAAGAFTAAREHGYDDAETTRGFAVATAAAQAGRVAESRPVPAPSEEADSSADQPGAWQRAWNTMSHATGVIAETVARVVLWLIGLFVAAGIAMRAWRTLTGQEDVDREQAVRFRSVSGLPVVAVEDGTGTPRRALGRVRRLLYDPAQRRLVGIQTGGRWSWRVAPIEAICGLSSAGVFVSDPQALVPGQAAPSLAEYVRKNATPLGGDGLKRVLLGNGKMLGFARHEQVWIDPATRELWFDLTPSRFHEAWRVAVSVLQIGPLDWLLGRMLDRGLGLLPGRVSVTVRLPIDLIRATHRQVVVVADEAAEQVDAHLQRLDADARARLAQVREGVAKAGPVLGQMRDVGMAKARPVIEQVRDAGLTKAGPVIERLRESSAQVARPVIERVRGVEVTSPPAPPRRGEGGGNVHE